MKEGNEAVAGTVNGPVTGITLAYVSSEATVDDAVVLPQYKTEFMVEGALWFTAYGADGDENALTLPEAVPVDNAILAGWTDQDNNTYYKDPADGQNGLGDYAANADNVMTANVDRNIYTITIYANEAVDDVFIDGQIMQKGMFGNAEAGWVNGYQLTVAAGNHSITYTLANGYSGNGELALVSGNTTVSGTTFTTSGTDAADMAITLQLTGFEKTGYVPESPDTGSDSGDSGMTITDYLLIVLVVLIIVMAIIVAMRLMRS